MAPCPNLCLQDKERVAIAAMAQQRAAGGGGRGGSGAGRYQDPYEKLIPQNQVSRLLWPRLWLAAATSAAAMWQRLGLAAILAFSQQAAGGQFDIVPARTASAVSTHPSCRVCWVLCADAAGAGGLRPGR